ncbi:MAG: hypothetical protein AB7O98_06435 [Hyphomonadaceae bacterium]
MNVSGLIVAFGVALFGGLGYHFYSVQQYEAAVDARMERELMSATLTPVQAMVSDNGGADPAAYLRSLYENEARSEQINLGYAALAVSWPRAYRRLERIRMPRDPRGATGKLEAEIDERFGSGAYALMTAQYERYRREAPARARALAERRQREAEWMMQYITDYVRRHGRYPTVIPQPPADVSASPAAASSPQAPSN